MTGPVRTVARPTGDAEHVARAKARRAFVAEMRGRGVRGGRIRAHRAMAGVPMSPLVAVNMLAVPFALALGVMFLLPWVTEQWTALFRALAGPLALGPTVGVRVVSLGDLYALAIPFTPAPGAWPTARVLAVGAAATAAVLAVSFALPARQLPARYALRALVAIQAITLGYFALATPPFAYTLPDYLVGFLSTGAAVLVFVPLLLGLTYFPFRFPLWRKVALTAMLVAHLAVLFPLQALLHAYLIARASLVALPVLFLAFGLLVEIFVFVAFYGWGMSWDGSDDR